MNIGAVLEATEDEHGLRIRAKFDEESEIAQYTRKLVKEGRLSKLSFSYDTRDSAVVILEDGRHVRELRDIKLYEISLVPIPANPEISVGYIYPIRYQLHEFTCVPSSRLETFQ